MLLVLQVQSRNTHVFSVIKNMRKNHVGVTLVALIRCNENTAEPMIVVGEIRMFMELQLRHSQQLAIIMQNKTKEESLCLSPLP